MKILPIADIHNEWGVFDYIIDELEGSFDVLTISGDIFEGRILYPQNFIDLMDDFQKKIGVPIILTRGNHDFWAKNCFTDYPNIHILHNESMEFGGKVFYGSPYTTHFFDWNFMATEEQLYGIWNDTIPDHVDVGLFHSPVYGFCDEVTQKVKWADCDQHLGSNALNSVLNRKNIDYLFHGHIHSTERHQTRISTMDHKTEIFNVSVLDENYDFNGFNPLPKVVEI